MKILYISTEYPYPANHGGRVDTWNRLQAMDAVGHSLFLITWTEAIKGDIPDEHAEQTVKSVCKHYITFKLKRGAFRLFRLFKYPSLVAARLLTKSEYQNTLKSAREFGPNLIFADNIYGGQAAMKLAADLNVPLFVRTHNLEAFYLKGQYALCTSLKPKLSLAATIFNLEKFENDLLRKAAHYFDISAADLAARKEQGFNNGHWLPPVHKSVFLKPSNKPHLRPGEYYDICFLGNLSSPNNITGVAWFITTVLPLISKQIPEISFLVMGSNPDSTIQELCQKDNITLIANHYQPEIYFQNSKVLINPVRFASGVNIKAIDMLFTKNAVVSTSYGITGLPDDFKKAFLIADDEQDFANKVTEALKIPIANEDVRNELRKDFGLDNIKIITNVLDNNL